MKSREGSWVGHGWRVDGLSRAFVDGCVESGVGS